MGADGRARAVAERMGTLVVKCILTLMGSQEV
jgi:hypothetical protein